MDDISQAIGFPIVARNAYYSETLGRHVFDVQHLRREVFRQLVTRPAAHTQAEMQFIRHYMRLTPEELHAKERGYGMPGSFALRCVMAEFLDEPVYVNDLLEAVASTNRDPITVDMRRLEFDAPLNEHERKLTKDLFLEAFYKMSRRSCDDLERGQEEMLTKEEWDDLTTKVCQWNDVDASGDPAPKRFGASTYFAYFIERLVRDPFNRILDTP